MTESLDELRRLTTVMDAKLTLTIEDGCSRVCFKAAGRSAEVVKDSSLHLTLDELLKRLDYSGAPVQQPTNAEFMRRLKQRPAKLARLHALLTEIRELKRDVLMPIEELEPVLASPRSSLNPQFMEVERD